MSLLAVAQAVLVIYLALGAHKAKQIKRGNAEDEEDEFESEETDDDFLPEEGDDGSDNTEDEMD